MLAAVYQLLSHDEAFQQALLLEARVLKSAVNFFELTIFSFL
jgi:hypothetical protein